MADKHCLIGKVVTAVHLADDNMAIKFDVADGEPIIARTDGDCCSHTWIENVENVEALIGAAVLSVRNIDMPEAPPRDNDYDVIAYYGCGIATAKGECILDYRNSSNGYYGGSLSWPDDSYYYGGVHGQNKSTETWKRIMYGG